MMKLCSRPQFKNKKMAGIGFYINNAMESDMKSSFKKLNATLLVTALTVSSVFNGAALAATDGTLGATSTGSANINVKKAAVVRISGMSDMSLAAYTLGDGNQALATDACVYSSIKGGKYKVKATGSGTDGAFSIADGTEVIPYSVVWNSGGQGALGTTGDALTAGEQLATVLTKASTTSVDCAAGKTAKLNINFLGTDLDAAPAGDYSGVITIEVAAV